MSTTLPVDTTGAHAAAPTCPTCEGPLKSEGESPLGYWSCGSCNLIFLA
ncbi:hypothetical protein [Naasia sp. SYSU D00948]|nr:hypothetical protein [Naasia sp. SYSU D00948]